MNGIKFRYKFLTMVLIFGMAIVGSVLGQDTALNGTWESSDGEEFIFSNGDFKTYSNAVPNMRGTYTANNGEITIRLTYIYGLPIDLENRWYSVNELSILFSIEETAFEITWDYFIRGNRLSIFMEGLLVVYIKQ